ncbi:MAG: HU family DNA-binding protein [Gemmatimonadetes bacterium]|nr:HU family DNA-binding protein [Gemmatimonadota bacterium]
MTKDEFAEKLAKKADLSKAKAKEVIEAIFSTEPRNGIIAIEMDAGRDFTITGFGTFGTRHRKQREGRNPRTGESITIPAMKVPTFRAGRGLKERVRD